MNATPRKADHGSSHFITEQFSIAEAQRFWTAKKRELSGLNGGVLLVSCNGFQEP